MFNHILVPLDRSVLAECVLPHVVTLAQALEARVTLLSVPERCDRKMKPKVPADQLAWQIRWSDGVIYLNHLAARLAESGLPVEKVVLEAPAAQSIVEYIRAHGVDLVVLSSHGQSGLNGWIIGSIAHKVLLQAHVSAMVVRACGAVDANAASMPYRRLLVPLDGSCRAERVLPLIATLSHRLALQLMLTCVVRQPELPRRFPISAEDAMLAGQLLRHNQEYARLYLERLRSQFAGSVETYVLVGDDVARSLHEFVAANQVDLVVLSAHGSAGNPHWPYGSVATNLLFYVSTPLLIVQDFAAAELRPIAEEALHKQFMTAIGAL